MMAVQAARFDVRLAGFQVGAAALAAARGAQLHLGVLDADDVLEQVAGLLLGQPDERLALLGGGPEIDDEHRLGRTGLFQAKRIAGRNDRHHA